MAKLITQFHDRRLHEGLLAAGDHYYISSPRDVSKIILANGTRANCVYFHGQSGEGYYSAGCGSLNDSTGNSSFQLDDNQRFKGEAGRVLRALRGYVYSVRFCEVVLGEWIWDFAFAVHAEAPYCRSEFTDRGEKTRIVVDWTKLKKKKEALQQAHLESGKLRNSFDQLAGIVAKRERLTRTYTVSAGDSLSSIARKFYSNPAKWTDIYAANKGKIGPNPNALRVGTKLDLP